MAAKEITLTKHSIEEAVRNVEPGPIRRYIVIVNGVRFPIKQVISLASGRPPAAFVAADSLTETLSHTIQPDVAARARAVAASVRTDGAEIAARRLILALT